MQLDLERVPTNETKKNRKAPKAFSEQVFQRMHDNGNKCFRLEKEEISYKATFIKYMKEIVNEIKESITRDLFDSIQIEVKEDNYVGQNVINLNSSGKFTKNNFIKTVTSSYNNLNFECLDHYLEYALDSTEKKLCKKDHTTIQFAEDFNLGKLVFHKSLSQNYHQSLDGIHILNGTDIADFIQQYGFDNIFTLLFSLINEDYNITEATNPTEESITENADPPTEESITEIAEPPAAESITEPTAEPTEDTKELIPEIIINLKS